MIGDETVDAFLSALAEKDATIVRLEQIILERTMQVAQLREALDKLSSDNRALEYQLRIKPEGRTS